MLNNNKNVTAGSQFNQRKLFGSGCQCKHMTLVTYDRVHVCIPVQSSLQRKGKL